MFVVTVTSHILLVHFSGKIYTIRKKTDKKLDQQFGLLLGSPQMVHIAKMHIQHCLQFFGIQVFQL